MGADLDRSAGEERPGPAERSVDTLTFDLDSTRVTSQAKDGPALIASRGGDMAENDAPGGVVASPTYMGDIRFFFRPEDVQHMAFYGIDLATYDGLKKHALQVYIATALPNPEMPPDSAGQWSADRSLTFKNWILQGYQLGTATAQPTGKFQAMAAPRDRVRKNAASLSGAEIEALKAAFTGLMQRDPKNADDSVDPNSYFGLAGLHGLPGIWCLHHSFPFNPWHRVYIKQFEDQLRSIPGCEDVTLPYWDFTTPLPALLKESPFAAYSLPQALKGQAFPYTTQRYPDATIAQKMEHYRVWDDVATSLNQSLWGDYNTNGYQDYSIQAHDGGHLATGPTMADQDVSAFDPVFWFYHCNIDRLWLTWQQPPVDATTLIGFKTTIAAGDADWLSPGLNALPPFTTTSDDTIAFGIAYDELAVRSQEVALENKTGSVSAAHRFSIKRTDPVSVRVKDIDRLGIPGSFEVNLLADGEVIATRAFFQPKSPRDCANCRQRALVNIDFRIDADKILDRQLSIEIEVPRLEESGTQFPLSQAGNPTINARLLLGEE